MGGFTTPFLKFWYNKWRELSTKFPGVLGKTFNITKVFGSRNAGQEGNLPVCRSRKPAENADPGKRASYGWKLPNNGDTQTHGFSPLLIIEEAFRQSIDIFDLKIQSQITLKKPV
jgi:hypothetical protein